jgi:predicted ferric reductase
MMCKYLTFQLLAIYLIVKIIVLIKVRQHCKSMVGALMVKRNFNMHFREIVQNKSTQITTTKFTTSIEYFLGQQCYVTFKGNGSKQKF